MNSEVVSAHHPLSLQVPEAPTQEIANANPRQNIRKLIKDGLVIKKPGAMHSRYGLAVLKSLYDESKRNIHPPMDDFN